MNETTGALRVETLALDAIIREAVAAAETSIDDGPSDRMVFLGNHHQAIPSAVVRDPVLEPVDKVIWMAIMLAVHDTGAHIAFPGYDALGRVANVASRSTVARAIAILRATRWLTLCARRRRVNGRFTGHVYALHDEPIPLVDALHLDADYLVFLQDTLKHRHQRVAAVARGVLDAIDDDIQSRDNLFERPHPIEQRLGSQVANDGSVSGRYFSMTRDKVQRLRHDLRQSNRPAQHQDQNLHTVDHHDQISNLSSSSINNKNTTTTSSGKIDASNFDLFGENGSPLIFPERLGDEHRETAIRYLSTLQPAQRQPILDELEGRFIAETKGMTPVYDEINFLQSLCTLMRRGKFKPNLGLRVRDARNADSRPETVDPRRDAKPLAKETEDARQGRIAMSRSRLSELRKILHTVPSVKNQNLTNET